MRCFVCRKNLEGNLIKCETCVINSLPVITFKGGGFTGSMKKASPTYNDLVREKAIETGPPKS